jgi:hypothetical protein
MSHFEEQHWVIFWEVILAPRPGAAPCASSEAEHADTVPFAGFYLTEQFTPRLRPFAPLRDAPRRPAKSPLSTQTRHLLMLYRVGL